MTREEMREKVARAACDAVNGDGAYDETGTLHREKVWHPAADAAIALVLEEAARVAEMLGGSVRKGNIIEALYVPPTAKDIAAAIRALKEKTNDRQ